MPILLGADSQNSCQSKTETVEDSSDISIMESALNSPQVSSNIQQANSLSQSKMEICAAPIFRNLSQIKDFQN
ncbi:11081_t:CDS:2 [Acaulospora morrowiae]|uniref:11081_t:CDS:1 n=1 Tax=Acaulospora morrowiae TaxID=94023 RepID=A0A9N9FVV1_9GLOM|nr:11081_t:CDS:2 [Acaulospora morrowiae]